MKEMWLCDLVKKMRFEAALRNANTTALFCGRSQESNHCPSYSVLIQVFTRDIILRYFVCVDFFPSLSSAS